MNTRLTMCQAQPGKTQDVLKIFRDSILPATKKQKGIQQNFLFTKANSDQVVWLSFWATEADLKSADTAGFFKEQIGKVKDLLTGPPITDMYEVAEKQSARFQLWQPRSRKSKANEKS